MLQNGLLKLSVAILIGIVSPSLSYCMKQTRANTNREKKEFFFSLKESLPQDVQRKIQQLIIHNAITFLSEQIITLRGHTKIVSSVAIDGNKLITGSNDETTKIWNLNTYRLLHTLKGHTREINSVAISGDKLATGSWDTTIKIWDMNTCKLLHTIKGHTNAIESIAINGDKLITGSWDTTVKIWDMNTYQLLHTLEGHTRIVWSVAIHGDIVVTGSMDNTAKIWSLAPFKGTPKNNPLLWIIERPDVLDEMCMQQTDFIKRVYETTNDKKDFIIALPNKLGKKQANESQAQKDGRIYFTFPSAVRAYLRNRLNIRK